MGGPTKPASSFSPTQETFDSTTSYLGGCLFFFFALDIANVTSSLRRTSVSAYWWTYEEGEGPETVSRDVIQIGMGLPWGFMAFGCWAILLLPTMGRMLG